MRYRKIKNYKSAGWVIRLLKQDIKDLELKDNDEVDISDLVKKKRSKK